MIDNSFEPPAPYGRSRTQRARSEETSNRFLCVPGVLCGDKDSVSMKTVLLPATLHKFINCRVCNYGRPLLTRLTGGVDGQGFPTDDDILGPVAVVHDPPADPGFVGRVLIFIDEH